jgi:cobalamin biosynthetic protein CobC
VDDIPGTDGADIIVVVNPNNPDGRTFPPAKLIDLSRSLAARGGFLVVDEAFADVDPEGSVIPHLCDDAIIVLKSFGKFFGRAAAWVCCWRAGLDYDT